MPAGLVAAIGGMGVILAVSHIKVCSETGALLGVGDTCSSLGEIIPFLHAARRVASTRLRRKAPLHIRL